MKRLIAKWKTDENGNLRAIWKRRKVRKHLNKRLNA